MKVACLQITSTDSVDENIAMIAPMVAQAAREGTELIALPENCFLMASGRKFHEQVYTQEEHPGILAAKEWAKTHGIWLILGSVAVQSSEKYKNRELVISPTGDITATYDKIHLFDVSVPGGESHQESKRFEHGTHAIVTQAGAAKLGLSICYDVRFPYLYRSLAKAGAEILTIPAAFTRFTGEKGGWHVLCRARAMETGCFVIAPAQCGTHLSDRQTYGHSLILNPWGEILAEAGTEPEIITAEIDLGDILTTRAIMPSLTHDREYMVNTI